jgi:hypothetical protein
MTAIYKTLFEIKLLHEYFLTAKDGGSIFEKANQQDRLIFLQDEFTNDQSPINTDIAFEFPSSLQSKYKSSLIKILPSYSGCRVIIQVKSRKLSNQSTVFEPIVPITNDFNIFILATRKNSGVDSYTNARVNRPLPAVYFFSNSELIGQKSFPFLTNDISAQDAGFLYEQGELSLSGSNIQEYYREAGTDKWNNVIGSGYANENDRLLLPEKFQYFFSNITNLTQAIFILKDKNGNEISNITINNPTGITANTTLNFTGKVKAIPVSNAEQFSDIVYTLGVSGNNGYSANHTIIFSNDFTRTAPWAVFAIRPAVTNNLFNLFANDDFLITRKDSLGVWTPAPVFEIPVKSRLAYWRYINNKGKELNISLELTDYLNKEGKVLVTKKPRSLSRSWFFLRKEASTDTAYVPNPIATELKIEPDRRLFYDIMVPQSDLFPEAP